MYKYKDCGPGFGLQSLYFFLEYQGQVIVLFY